MANSTSNSQPPSEQRLSTSPESGSHRRRRHRSRSRSSGGRMSRTERYRSHSRESRSRRRERERSRSRGAGGSTGRSKNRERRREKRRNTGWDDAPSECTESATGPSTTSLTNQDNSIASSMPRNVPEPTGKELHERQAQAANIAAMMQTKASLSQLCRIYVGSLDYSLTETDIRSVFSAFGQIVNIDMPKEGARSKGFCFVEYTSPECAEMALTTMQGFLLKGRSIKVGRPTALGGQAGNPAISNLMAGLGVSAPLTSSVVSLGSLSPTGNKTDVAAELSAAQAGVMAAASLIASRPNPPVTIDTNSSNSPLSNSAMAGAGNSGMSAAAVSALSQFSNAQSAQNRVYVGSVPYSFTGDDVKQIFQVFGPILSCQLIPSNERPGTHRGYGFIEFGAQEHSKLAIETMNGFEVGGKQLKVNYATALRNNSSISGGMSPGSFMSGFCPGSPGSPSATGANAILMSSDMNELVNGGFEGMGGEHMLSSNDNKDVGRACFPNSRIIMLTNMVTLDDVDDFLKEEIRQECQKYGSIADVHIEAMPTSVRIFVTFTNIQEALNAIPHLQNRWFDGRQIQCRQYDPEAFASADYWR